MRFINQIVFETLKITKILETDWLRAFSTITQKTRHIDVVKTKRGEHDGPKFFLKNPYC